MTRITEHIDLPVVSAGTRRQVTLYRWGGGLARRAYIQASLHADETPGLLVAHHLVRLLDRAAEEARIAGEIVVVPIANPIGLDQHLADVHLGRYHAESGENFNRGWPALTETVAGAVADRLGADPDANVAAIRGAIRAATLALPAAREDQALKRALFLEAGVADLVLDLHCDSEAVLHLYLGTPLWPDARDLAGDLKSHAHLLAETSGGNPFDEACSTIWWELAARFPDKAIPNACLSATVELRGGPDVDDATALADAEAIARLLTRRGFLTGEAGPVPPLLAEATPLDGVDMIEAEVAGVAVWTVAVGDRVEKGQTLGEIVDLEDAHAPRTPIVARTSGVLFARKREKLVRPGQPVAKVAGAEPLPWRTGNLLTSR